MRYVGDLYECLVELIYDLAKKRHSEYCDYPCFTKYDVKQYLIYMLKNEFKAEYNGTSVITPWGIFGNTSYDHFVDSVSYAINEILNKFEEEE